VAISIDLKQVQNWYRLKEQHNHKHLRDGDLAVGELHDKAIELRPILKDGFILPLDIIENGHKRSERIRN
jgi:hypothetical protein